jgi:hypothetical protein
MTTLLEQPGAAAPSSSETEPVLALVKAVDTLVAVPNILAAEIIARVESGLGEITTEINWKVDALALIGVLRTDAVDLTKIFPLPGAAPDEETKPFRQSHNQDVLGAFDRATTALGTAQVNGATDAFRFMNRAKRTWQMGDWKRSQAEVQSALEALRPRQ